MQVEAFKTKAEEILKKEPKIEERSSELLEDASVAKLFEEIKIMFQDLPSRIDKNVRMDYREKRRRIDPMMINELIHLTKIPSVGITIALSLFKETSLHWIYDLGIELLNVLKSKKAKSEKEKAFHEFAEIIEMATRHPMMRELHYHSKYEYLMLRDVSNMLLKNMHQIYNL